MIDLAQLVTFMRRSQQVIPALVADLSEEQFRWKPPSQNWSVLEILGHLVAEETLDFRPRIQSTLADPNQPWPSYQPEELVTAEKMNEKNPESVLLQFDRERSKSLNWLESLNQPDWDLAYQHPRLGPLRAGDLMLSWAAHDQLHVRQIAKRHFEMIQHAGSRYSTSYAGDL